MDVTDESIVNLNQTLKDFMVVLNMLAENQLRISKGEAPAYGEHEINLIIGPY